MLALTRFLVLCAAMLALPANASAQPGPAFISPYDGASINDNDALVFNVVPVPNAGGFGGGYLWAIVQGGRGIIWENWRDTHTLNGPTLVIAKGSTAYNVIPKDTWVDIVVRALVNNQWTDESKITVFVARIAGTGFDPGKYLGKSGLVSNFDTSLLEPNDFAHRNYCGPAASRVLISAWTNNVPGLEALAVMQKTNPDAGTFARDMFAPINVAIGTPYYGVVVAKTQGDLSNMIGNSILDNGRPLIVALMTQPRQSHVPLLNGWQDRYPNIGAPHIVMVYGFDFRSASVAQVDYFETAGTVAAGPNIHPGTQWIPYRDFWRLVSLNNVEIANACYAPSCPGPCCAR